MTVTCNTTRKIALLVCLAPDFWNMNPAREFQPKLDSAHYFLAMYVPVEKLLLENKPIYENGTEDLNSSPSIATWQLYDFRQVTLSLSETTFVHLWKGDVDNSGRNKIRSKWDGWGEGEAGRCDQREQSFSYTGWINSGELIHGNMTITIQYCTLEIC